MSRLQGLKVFINQRLTAAVEEIFGLLEKTISEYEEELESRRHSALLDAVSHRKVTPQTAGFPADVQVLLVSKEDVPPEQQKCRPSLDQEDPPELPHIKEEQEELWTSQEGEQLGGLQDADITKFTFTPVPVKSEEDDEEQPQSSQFHQKQTEENREADGDDSGGPEPARNLHPDTHSQPDSFVKTSPFSETENADMNYYFLVIREPQPDLNSNVVPMNDIRCNTGAKSYSCSECGRIFGLKGTLRRHMRHHTGEKPFSCSVCGKRFTQSGALVHHRRLHTGEKPFACSVCNASFSQKVTLEQHMRIHTGERPFSCSVCGKRFTQKGNLNSHMTVHTGEKAFSCSVCDKRFTRQARLKNHKCLVEGSSSSLEQIV